MKPDIGIAGAVGVLIGMGIYLIASAASAQIGGVIQNPVGIGVVFVILLGFALAEIPLMVFGLTKIAASTTPRAFLLGTHLVYVTFASVYASIFIVLTAQAGLGGILIAILAVRFFTGVLFK